MHDHHHHHDKRRRFFHTKTFRLFAMLSLTFSYFVVELIVGNITKSVALIADSFHMLSDVISLVIGIVAVRIAKKRSDANTFGWVRAEIVGANINTVFLLALCLTIVFDAIKRFIEPEPIENINLLLIVGSIGLAINLVGLFLFRGFHGHSHGGAKETNITNVTQQEEGDATNETKKPSMNMHGVFLHVLADALGSVVVIISALIIKFVPRNSDDLKHWTVYIDPALSMIIVMIITISTIPLFRDTTSILLQTIPKYLEVQHIKTQLLQSIPEITSIHELHIWRLTDEKIIATAHLHRKTFDNYMLVADKVKSFFHLRGIHSITMQYECESDFERKDSQTKIAGDCLLRCENIACDEQNCCTLVSARSETLLSIGDENPTHESPELIEKF